MLKKEKLLLKWNTQQVLNQSSMGCPLRVQSVLHFEISASKGYSSKDPGLTFINSTRTSDKSLFFGISLSIKGHLLFSETTLLKAWEIIMEQSAGEHQGPPYPGLGSWVTHSPDHNTALLSIFCRSQVPCGPRGQFLHTLSCCGALNLITVHGANVSLNLLGPRFLHLPNVYYHSNF